MNHVRMRSTRESRSWVSSSRAAARLLTICRNVPDDAQRQRIGHGTWERRPRPDLPWMAFPGPWRQS